MVGLLLTSARVEEPVSPPHDTTSKKSSLVMRFRLGGAESSATLLDDIVDEARLSARDIRVLAQRKLSSRSCSLRRALLIQNALPLLEDQAEMKRREQREEEEEADRRMRQEEEEEEQREELFGRVASHSLSSEEEEEELLEMDLAADRMSPEEDSGSSRHMHCPPSPPTTATAEEEVLNVSSSSSPSSDAVEPELDACYQAAMRAFDDFSESDLLLCDAEEAVSAADEAVGEEDVCGELYVLASACVEQQQSRCEALAAAVMPSPSQARKRRGSSEADEAASLKCPKPVRSASPCGLTQRVSGTVGKLSCARSVFSVIQC